MNRLIITLILIFTIYGNASDSLAIDCEPLKPTKQVDTEVKRQIEGSLNILFKKLGSGDFNYEYNKVQKDVLSKYPNSDKLVIWNTNIYFLCTFLDSSTELSDNEKFEKFQWIVVNSQQGPPDEKTEPNAENNDSNNSDN